MAGTTVYFKSTCMCCNEVTEVLVNVSVVVAFVFRFTDPEWMWSVRLMSWVSQGLIITVSVYCVKRFSSTLYNGYDECHSSLLSMVLMLWLIVL